MRLEEIILGFFIYGFLGWCTEVAFAAVVDRKFVNRGFLNGPICPIYGIGIISVAFILHDYQNDIVKLYCLSAIVVTLLEWMTGIVLEKLFHHRWWDYSHLPLNIQGYICLPFSLAWGVACVVVIHYIHPFTLKLIHFIPEFLAVGMIAALAVVFTADVYVTVHEIFKLNMKLKKMQEIADDMENISEYLGENLSKNVINTMERREERKKRLEESLQEHFSAISYSNKRLLQAFPRMQSLKYKEQLQTVRDYLEEKKQKTK